VLQVCTDVLEFLKISDFLSTSIGIPIPIPILIPILSSARR